MLQEGKQEIIRNLLKPRFGELDEELSKVIKPLLQLPLLGVYPPAPQLGPKRTLESVQRGSSLVGAVSARAAGVSQVKAVNVIQHFADEC